MLTVWTTIFAIRTVQSVFIPEAYPGSNWGRMMDADKLDPTVLGRMVEGTMQAFESGSVPVINPFQFLEIGLQTAFNHRRAGALLWITGLDGLLAAEKRDAFTARLTRLLGKDAAVFPKDCFGREPVYTVGQMAGRIFKWRGLIAHGKKILDELNGSSSSSSPRTYNTSVLRSGPRKRCCRRARSSASLPPFGRSLRRWYEYLAPRALGSGRELPG